MSTKYFCDACGVETRGQNSLNECKVLNKRGVLVAKFCTANLISERRDLHVCKYCLIDAVTRFDDRPRQAPEAGAP